MRLVFHDPISNSENMGQGRHTMSQGSTDLSSDFDVTAVETNAFDKQELIVWASKLELESIDYRITCMELIEKLTKLSKSLNDSFQAVNEHLHQIRSNASKQETKMENFICVMLSGELDDAYSKISFLSNKIKSLQDSIYQVEHSKLTDLESKLNSHTRSLKSKDNALENRIEKLEQLVEEMNTSREYDSHSIFLPTPPVNEHIVESKPILEKIPACFQHKVVNSTRRRTLTRKTPTSKPVSKPKTKTKTKAQAAPRPGKARSETSARILIFEE